VSTSEGQVYVGSSSLSFSLILAQYQSSVLQWGLLSPLRTDLGKLKSSLPREKEREEERGRSEVEKPRTSSGFAASSSDAIRMQMCFQYSSASTIPF
jgi:hypothetical protein